MGPSSQPAGSADQGEAAALLDLRQLLLVGNRGASFAVAVGHNFCNKNKGNKGTKITVCGLEVLVDEARVPVLHTFRTHSVLQPGISFQDMLPSTNKINL